MVNRYSDLVLRKPQALLSLLLSASLTHSSMFSPAWPDYWCVFAHVACRLFTSVLCPGCGLQPIGWNRKCRNWVWRTHTEREKEGGGERKNSVKWFVERRDLTVLYIDYIYFPVTLDVQWNDNRRSVQTMCCSRYNRKTLLAYRFF